jgi:hypothetical protein
VGDMSKEELTDQIDSCFDEDTVGQTTTASEEILSDIKDFKPSSDLTDSLEFDEGSSADNSPGMEVIKAFEKVQREYNSELIDKMNLLNFAGIENKEQILRDVARRVYEEIHKASKKYLATWCKVNRVNQKWSNPFAQEFSMKKLIYTIEEHRKQVDSQIYVPISIRDKWQKELEEKLNNVSGEI